LKGDGNIRYYEITESEPYIHYLSEYKSSTPQRGLGFMPKRGLDVTKNEVYRFYKLHATGGICEPISMIVPRKSEMFQEDIYPDTASGIPSISCDEWLTGVNRDPILISLKDGAIPFMPKIVTYKQMGYSELGNNFSRLGKPVKLTNGLSKPGNAHNGEHHNGSSNGQLSNGHHKNDISGYTEVTLIDSIKKFNYANSNGLMGSWSQTEMTSTSSALQDSAGNKINGFESIQQNTKLILSSRSAFSKTSSSSSHSLSPPSSPNQSVKYLNKDSQALESNGANNTTSTSSNESVNQVPHDDFLLKTVPQVLNKSHLKNHVRHNVNRQLEELEASYVTSMSRNPITLRKTESLKLESAQHMK
jgi:hypothetical protein